MILCINSQFFLNGHALNTLSIYYNILFYPLILTHYSIKIDDRKFLWISVKSASVKYKMMINENKMRFVESSPHTMFYSP